MSSKTNTVRRASALIAAAALVGLAAPAALADPPQSHRASARLVTSERSTSLGQTRSVEATPVRPDDRGGARIPVASGEPAQPSVTVSPDGFQWGDAMIGAAVAAGALLLAGALASMVRQWRRIALS